MATITGLNGRKPDLRDNFLPNPYWISFAIQSTWVKGKGCILTSYPTIANKPRGIIIHNICCDVIQPLGDAAVLNLSVGTITPDSDEVITYDNAGGLMPAADITANTKGRYFVASGPMQTAKAGGLTTEGANLISRSIAPIPVVFCHLSGTVDPLGEFRFHMQISEIPV